MLKTKSLSFASKLSVVRDRAFAVKLLYPSQKTVHHIVTAIAAVHKPDASPNQLFDWVNETKEAFNTGRASVGTPAQTQVMASMILFPSSPVGLPSELYTAVYQDSPPIAPVISNLSSFAASCTSQGGGHLGGLSLYPDQSSLNWVVGGQWAFSRYCAKLCLHVHWGRVVVFVCMLHVHNFF